jgi:hypothetical protein
LDELFNAESGIGDDAAERAGSELPVVGNNDPCVRSVAPKHHVAACLAAEDEPGALQGGADLAAR